MFAFLPQICAAYLLVVSFQKELKKKQKQKQSKNKTKQNETKLNETKRNETKRNETKQTKQTKKNKTKQNKTKQKQKRVKGLKKIFCTHKSSYIFKHFESLPSIPLNGLYRNDRSCPLKNSRPNSRKLFPSTGKNPIINSIKVYHTNLTFSR